MRLALTVLAPLVFGGCAAIPTNLETPEVSFVSLRAVEASFFEQLLEVRMKVRNPNDIELPVNGLDVGVIAGDRATYPFFSRLFEDAHDGLVSVASTRVEGASDAIVVPCGHSFIAGQPVTIHQTLHFLLHGRFDPDAVPAGA